MESPDTRLAGKAAGITSIALAGLLVVGGVGATALASLVSSDASARAVEPSVGATEPAKDSPVTTPPSHPDRDSDHSGEAGGSSAQDKEDSTSDEFSSDQLVKDAVLPAEEDWVYLVVEGDTHAKVSGEVGVSVDRLAAVNEIVDVDRILVGEAILVPAS